MAQQAPQICQGCGMGLVPGGVICPNCKQHYFSPPGVIAADWGIRFFAAILDCVIAIFTLFIGWLIWALIVFGNGQTPGKALLGIRAIKVSGAPADWGLTFVREILVKWIVMGIASGLTSGISWWADHLWPLWDRNVQALHDKMVGTLVVQQGTPRVPYQQPAAADPADPWRGDAAN